MLDYDDLAPRYVGICLICGEQVLKKKAVSIMYRAPYAWVLLPWLLDQIFGGKRHFGAVKGGAHEKQ